MKLYEFVYTDDLNLSQSRLLRRMQAFLETEAVTQGWASGYTLRQGCPPESADSSVKYFFEVVGHYLDSEEVGTPSQYSVNNTAPVDPAAARDADH